MPQNSTADDGLFILNTGAAIVKSVEATGPSAGALRFLYRGAMGSASTASGECVWQLTGADELTGYREKRLQPLTR